MKLRTHSIDTADLERMAGEESLELLEHSSQPLTRGEFKGGTLHNFRLKPTGELPRDKNYNRKFGRRGAGPFNMERRIAATCWHGYRNVMLRIFAADPRARLTTAMADYRGAAQFLEDYEETGRRNIGAPIQPMQAREACDCFSDGTDLEPIELREAVEAALEDAGEPAEPSGSAPRVDPVIKRELRDGAGRPIGTTATITQRTMLACPHFIMVPEHYRADGSCRCDDPDHLEMIEWGYRFEAGRWQ